MRSLQLESASNYGLPAAGHKVNSDELSRRVWVASGQTSPSGSGADQSTTSGMCPGVWYAMVEARIMVMINVTEVPGVAQV